MGIFYEFKLTLKKYKYNKKYKKYKGNKKMKLPEFHKKYKEEILISLPSFRKRIRNNRDIFKSVSIFKNDFRDVIRIKDENDLLREWREFLA